jgi:hypothetical protein
MSAFFILACYILTLACMIGVFLYFERLILFVYLYRVRALSENCDAIWNFLLE